MVDTSKIADLVNASVDGALSPRQQDRLAKLRAEHPAVDTALQEMATVADRVRALERVEPPDGLKERILAALPPRSTSPARRRGFMFPPTWSLAAPNPALRLAAAFVGGLVVATLLFVVSQSEGVNASRAVGTIGSDAATAIEDATTSTIEISEPGFVGTATFRRSGTEVSLLIGGDAVGGARIVIGYEVEQAAFRGYDDRSVGAEAVASVEPGAISIAPRGIADLELAFNTRDTGAVVFVVKIGAGGVSDGGYEVTI